MITKSQNIFLHFIYHIIAVCSLLIVTIGFYKPAVLDNKTIQQHDIEQYIGSSADIRNYYNEKGESSEWTGGMFSGMPAYQIGVHGGSPNFLKYLDAPFKVLGSNTAGPLAAAMVATYFMLILLGFSVPVSIVGAIAYGFSSYNIILIDAGHVTKAWTLAFMPLTIGGMLMLFRKEYFVAALCVTLGLAMQLKSNHIQITYYTAISCLLIYAYFTILKFARGEIAGWFKSALFLFIGVILAILANAGNIYANYEMSKTSTRGPSELTVSQSSEASAKPSSGLEKDYVFSWSYGISESLSFMIPNIKGGSSQPFDENSAMMQTVSSMYQNNQIDRDNAMFFLQRLGQYWGDQPMTSGPVYFGAVVCFLFILGLAIIQNRLKWMLLAVMLFFMFLSWGSNLAWFNDWFYQYFPMYNKFRAVSQTLVIPAMIVVFVAVWALKELFTNQDKAFLLQMTYWCGGILAFICFILWVAPSTFFSFLTSQEEAFSAQLPPRILAALTQDRENLLSADALRSLIFILLSSGFIIAWLYGNKEKRGYNIMTFGIIILVLVDLWNVDNRYLPESKFVAKKSITRQPSLADKAIMADNDDYSRVFNLNNPFQETSTSYFHRSIGGYHAAKLQRYQQLIDKRLSKEYQEILDNLRRATSEDSIKQVFLKTPTLNMLNARYITYNPDAEPIVNPYTFGSAWFVDKYIEVNTPDEEIAALNDINPKTEAVIDISFKNKGLFYDLTLRADSANTIKLVEYSPNVLVYKSHTKSEQLAVFSEIYYEKGWNAYVDGIKTPIFRADWILRAMIVPEGSHEIVFKFEPFAYRTARNIESIVSGTLIIIIIISIYLATRRKREEEGLI